MKKFGFQSTFCLVFFVSLTITGSSAWAQQCTIEPMEGRTIIDLEPQDVCSPIEKLGICEGQAPPVSVSPPLPAGVYDVTLQSHDNHSDKLDQTQTNERYFLSLNNGTNMIVGTDAIDDLPEDQDNLIQLVNTNLLVGDDIDSIVAIHYCDGNNGCIQNINSISPVCVAFDLIEQFGGEGCTPGYWKQTQHFDSWTALFMPDTLFADVFEDAFPGQTLLQVLQQGGGGLNALGRHTVAALLNAASSGVSYDESVSAVITLFNQVFPNTKAAYTTLKNNFEGLNEQGCPLN